MKKSTLRLTAAAAALVITTALVAGISSAEQNDGSGFMKMPPEMNQAVVKALEDNDYDTWKELMGDNKITEAITPENFSQLVKMYQLVQQGDYQGANEIRKELNLPVRPQKVRALAKNIIRSLADREAIDQAIKNNDYQAWVKAINGQGEELSVINESNWSQYVDAQNLIMAGRDQMQQGMDMLKDLGLKQGQGWPGNHQMPPVTEQPAD